MVLCSSCDGVPFKIWKENRTGLQFTSTDYLSIVLTPVRIHWTVPWKISFAEICLEWSDTPQKFVRRGMIPRRNLLREIWYPTEICSERYDTQRKFVLRGMIPRWPVYDPTESGKKFWRLASPFKGILFQKTFHVKVSIPKGKRIHA